MILAVVARRMNPERDSHGRIKPQHSDEAVIAAIKKHSPAATSEVGEELGIARQSADYRLRKLADEERVKKKKIGASLVWVVASAETGDEP